MDRDYVTMADELARGLEALFERCPALCGFTIQDFEPMLIVDDLSIFPPVGAEQRETIGNEIAQTLIALVTDRPAAQDVLRGRTIARALH